MVTRQPIKVRLKDYKPWQIGLAGFAALALLVSGAWSLTSRKSKIEFRPRKDFQDPHSDVASAKPYRAPAFEPGAVDPPLQQSQPFQGAQAQPQSGPMPTALPGPGNPGPLSAMPQPLQPLMPDMSIPGAMPGGFPEADLDAMPGMPPNVDQLSPKFLTKNSGFSGPNPFALMPQGAGPDAEIFARLPKVEMPQPPKMPAFPAPPKGYLNEVNNALQESRQRLSEPPRDGEPSSKSTEPAAKQHKKSEPRELPQG